MEAADINQPLLFFCQLFLNFSARFQYNYRYINESLIPLLYETYGNLLSDSILHIVLLPS